MPYLIRLLPWLYRKQELENAVEVLSTASKERVETLKQEVIELRGDAAQVDAQ